MIEKIAAEIARSLGSHVVHHNHVDAAKAALTALLEPDSKMVEAIRDSDCIEGYYDDFYPEVAFKAAIKSALEGE